MFFVAVAPRCRLLKVSPCCCVLCLSMHAYHDNIISYDTGTRIREGHDHGTYDRYSVHDTKYICMRLAFSCHIRHTCTQLYFITRHLFVVCVRSACFPVVSSLSACLSVSQGQLDPSTHPSISRKKRASAASRILVPSHRLDTAVIDPPWYSSITHMV